LTNIGNVLESLELLERSEKADMPEYETAVNLLKGNVCSNESTNPLCERAYLQNELANVQKRITDLHVRQSNVLPSLDVRQSAAALQQAHDNLAGVQHRLAAQFAEQLRRWILFNEQHAIVNNQLQQHQQEYDTIVGSTVTDAPKAAAPEPKASKKKDKKQKTPPVNVAPELKQPSTSNTVAVMSEQVEKLQVQ
jgi:hypothetical protein